MAFGNRNEAHVMVYAYGAPKGVSSGGELVTAQMGLAHRYKNQLVEIERRRRDRVREAFRTHGTPEMAVLRDRVDQLSAEFALLQKGIAQHKQAAGSRHIPDEFKKRRAELRQQLRTARDSWREAKKAAREHVPLQDELARINQESVTELKQARRTSGLYWGTYCHVEQVLGVFRKSRTDPRFQKPDGSGTVAVQLQQGMPVSQAFSAADRRLQIIPSPGHRTHAMVRLRVNSDDKNPVWAEIPIVMHRPLPPKGRIKWARLVRRRVGRRMRYSVQFVVEVPNDDQEKNAADKNAAVAFDFNWRLLPEGLRVACWVGTDDKKGTIILPRDWLQEMDRVDSLQSIRDRLFNDARAFLTNWMGKTPQLPDWLRESTATIHHWRSIGRLARLVGQWGRERFNGDADAYEQLSAWRLKDAHLLEWESNLRDQLLARRRDIYRVEAARVGKQYGVCVLEKMDLRNFAGREGPAEAAPDKTRLMRSRAALSTLRAALTRTMSVVVVSAVHSTQICHACGYLQRMFDAARKLRWRCESCQVEWDQDDNAAHNLLRRYREQASASGSKNSESARAVE